MKQHPSYLFLFLSAIHPENMLSSTCDSKHMSGHMSTRPTFPLQTYSWWEKKLNESRLISVRIRMKMAQPAIMIFSCSPKSSFCLFFSIHLFHFFLSTINVKLHITFCMHAFLIFNCYNFTFFFFC